MSRYISKAAIALGAVLAVGGAASAGDRDTPPATGGAPSTTMTLGGKGTIAQAATEDTELARGYHGHYGGHYSGYGYGGYRGGYYGGYYGGYRSYYGGYYGGFYRPAYYGGYYRPAYYYTPRVYYSSYYSYPVYSNCYGSGLYIGIGGGGASAAPAVTLGAPAPQPMVQPVAPGDGTFRYDGGPANPVPLPKADPQPMVPPGTSATIDLPVSLKAKPATAPYRYKAYGEK